MNGKKKTKKSVTVKSESQDGKVMPSKIEKYNLIQFQHPLSLKSPNLGPKQHCIWKSESLIL